MTSPDMSSYSRTFVNRPRNSEPWSSDEDETRADELCIFHRLQSVIRLQDFLKEAQINDWRVQLYQFRPSHAYRDIFWRIKSAGESRIVLDVKRDTLRTVLKHNRWQLRFEQIRYLKTQMLSVLRAYRGRLKLTVEWMNTRVIAARGPPKHKQHADEQLRPFAAGFAVGAHSPSGL
ncbi:glutamate receptor ionotropic, kainate 2 [Trichonephila clavipes]|nr:glutamate receptor ionotropic, kainate 2 [Trichonephila clavipes]